MGSPYGEAGVWQEGNDTGVVQMPSPPGSSSRDRARAQDSAAQVPQLSPPTSLEGSPQFSVISLLCHMSCLSLTAV